MTDEPMDALDELNNSIMRPIALSSGYKMNRLPHMLTNISDDKLR